MNRVLGFIAFVFFLPGLAIAADDIEAAAEDICKCGYPPSSRCLDDLAKAYPQINESSELQNEVMSKAQKKCGMGSSGLPQNGANTRGDSIPEMVGNEELDVSTLPKGIAEALSGINEVVSSTEDCSTQSFRVTIPNDWQCRKQDNNAQDVTLYTNGNKLNVTLGKNQGRTSCSVIPICTSENIELSNKFETKVYTNPMAGTYEYAGLFKDDGTFKITITSTTKPTPAQLDQIEAILDSFEKL